MSKALPSGYTADGDSWTTLSNSARTSKKSSLLCSIAIF